MKRVPSLSLLRKVIPLAFAFAVSGVAAPIAPLAQKWVARYNGPLNQDDYSSTTAVDATGDVYVAGYTTTRSVQGYANADFCLIKYRGQTGEQLWEWHANQPYPDSYSKPGYLSLVARLAMGPDDNPLVGDKSSDDLVTWGTADTTTLVNDWTTLTVRSNHPISEGGAHFLRIRFTSQ